MCWSPPPPRRSCQSAHWRGLSFPLIPPVPPCACAHALTHAHARTHARAHPRTHAPKLPPPDTEGLQRSEGRRLTGEAPQMGAAHPILRPPAIHTLYRGGVRCTLRQGMRTSRPSRRSCNRAPTSTYKTPTAISPWCVLEKKATVGEKSSNLVLSSKRVLVCGERRIIAFIH